MEVRRHTTPETRNALRKYLRNRMMTGSIHQAVTVQALNDLEEALLLLRGVADSSGTWRGEVEGFLMNVAPPEVLKGAVPLPGILEAE